nr:hypothetical protein [uncultured bacterium]
MQTFFIQAKEVADVDQRLPFSPAGRLKRNTSRRSDTPQRVMTPLNECLVTTNAFLRMPLVG